MEGRRRLDRRHRRTTGWLRSTTPAQCAGRRGDDQQSRPARHRHAGRAGRAIRRAGQGRAAARGEPVRHRRPQHGRRRRQLRAARHLARASPGSRTSGAGMRYGRNAAQATYASAQADFEFGRQSLAATIAKSWFTASETWLQLQIAEDMVKAGAGAGDAGGEALAGRPRQRAGRGARPRQPRHLPGHRQAGAARARADAARARTARSAAIPPPNSQARRDLPALPGAHPRRPAARDAGAPAGHGRRRAPRRRRLQSRRRSEGRAAAADHPQRQCRGHSERHPAIEGRFRESDRRRRARS